MGIGRFLFTTIDCVDPARLAPFWAEVLSTDIDSEMDDGRYVFLKGGDGTPIVCLQRVPETKAGKSRMHVDVSVPDLDAATARVIELGGSWPGQVERKLEGFTWRTLADPEGNEFDVALS